MRKFISISLFLTLCSPSFAVKISGGIARALEAALRDDFSQNPNTQIRRTKDYDYSNGWNPVSLVYTLRDKTTGEMLSCRNKEISYYNRGAVCLVEVRDTIIGTDISSFLMRALHRDFSKSGTGVIRILNGYVISADDGYLSCYYTPLRGVLTVECHIQLK